LWFTVLSIAYDIDVVALWLIFITFGLTHITHQ
jgi:hypothetical protein